MEAADLDRLKSKLLERREELLSLQKMSAGSRSVVELDQSSVGRVSRVDALQAQQMALATERNRAQELVRIDAALARMDDGSYGECPDCGEGIAIKRLEFDPAIVKCIGCAR